MKTFKGEEVVRQTNLAKMRTFWTVQLLEL